MSTTEDLRNQLAGDDGSLPERWNPDDAAGTTLVGTLLRYETLVTEFGETSLAVIQEDGTSTVYGVLLGRTVLKKRFDTLDPHPGDTLGLKYVGFQEPTRKDQRGYHNYVMRILRNSDAAQTPLLAADAKTPAPLGEDDLPF